MKLCTRRVDSTVLAHRKHSVNVTVLGIANVIVIMNSLLNAILH